MVTPRSFGLGRCSRADNEVNGVPSCASRELLTELTRSAWNFTGVWVSDCGAVQDVFANHKFAKSPVEAVRDVMDAGLDLNCGEHTLQFLCCGPGLRLPDRLVDQNGIVLSIEHP